VNETSFNTTPSNVPWASEARARSINDPVVFRARTTSTTPSDTALKTAASVNGTVGGVSMTIRSNRRRSSAKTLAR
jgi:hypothetical protein